MSAEWIVQATEIVAIVLFALAMGALGVVAILPAYKMSKRAAEIRRQNEARRERNRQAAREMIEWLEVQADEQRDIFNRELERRRREAGGRR